MQFNDLFTFAAFLSSAKSGGRFVTLVCETKIRTNKFPTDGSERIRIDESLVFTKRYAVTYNFGSDYEKAMSKALGEEYTASEQPNRVHIVPNVLLQLADSGKAYIIYINGMISQSETLCNGKPATEEQIAYLNRYKPKAKTTEVVKYRNVSIENVREMHINKEVHTINITNPTIVKVAM